MTKKKLIRKSDVRFVKRVLEDLGLIFEDHCVWIPGDLPENILPLVTIAMSYVSKMGGSLWECEINRKKSRPDVDEKTAKR